ncbi:hypothetical protein ACYSNO_08905 [Enterococcus sp. LJL98]
MNKKEVDNRIIEVFEERLSISEKVHSEKRFFRSDEVKRLSELKEELEQLKVKREKLME